jgi:hypothetical protein
LVKPVSKIEDNPYSGCRAPEYSLSDEMRKLIKVFTIIFAVYLSLSILAGILLAEGSLRLRHRPLSHRKEAVELVRQEFQTELQEVSVTAADSVVLKGWYVRPGVFNGEVLSSRTASPITAKVLVAMPRCS